MGIQLPLKGAEHPHFSAHVYCGQTAGIAGCIKMPLGTEVDLGPGHVVLDEDQVPSPERVTAAALLFSAHVNYG